MWLLFYSLRSRRLEVAGEREDGRARGRHARGPSRAPVFSCAHYFQAPATQANFFVSRACFLDQSFPLSFFLILTFVSQFSWNFGWLITCVRSLLSALQKEKCEKERGARQRNARLPRAPLSAPFWDLTTRQQRRKWKRRWKIWNFFALIPSCPVTWSMEIRLGDGLVVGTEGGDRVRVQRGDKNISRLVVAFSRQLENLTISRRSSSVTAEKCTN